MTRKVWLSCDDGGAVVAQRSTRKQRGTGRERVVSHGALALPAAVGDRAQNVALIRDGGNIESVEEIAARKLLRGAELMVDFDHVLVIGLLVGARVEQQVASRVGKRNQLQHALGDGIQTRLRNHVASERLARIRIDETRGKRAEVALPLGCRRN